MSDLQLYNNTINSQEFQSFLKRTGGTVVSSPIQQKRCTIEVQTTIGREVWVFYANGIIRKNTNSDRLGKVAEPRAGWPSNPTVDDMLSLVQLAIELIDRRNAAVDKKFERINNSKRHQVLLLVLLFDPQRIETNRYSKKDWSSLPSWDYKALALKVNDGLDAFVKAYGTANVFSTYRVK